MSEGRVRLVGRNLVIRETKQSPFNETRVAHITGSILLFHHTQISLPSQRLHPHS